MPNPIPSPPPLRFPGTKTFAVTSHSDMADREGALAFFEDASEMCRYILEDGHDVRDSEDGPAISLVSWKNSGQSDASNVAGIEGALLDFENRTDSQLACVREVLSDFEYLLWTTFRDSPGHRYFRVLVPFEDLVATPQQYTELWRELDELTWGLATRSSGTFDRICHLPAHPPGSTGAFIEHNLP